jgi:hypothetical protein
VPGVLERTVTLACYKTARTPKNHIYFCAGGYALYKGVHLALRLRCLFGIALLSSLTDVYFCLRLSAVCVLLCA